MWLLARLPYEYIISGERISPYLVFANTHDGSGAVRAAVTPVRVVCNNTLNLALSIAKRSWSMIHTGDMREKLDEAHDTLFIGLLLPMDENPTSQQAKNMRRLREDMKMRYYDAPDLQDVGHNAYRFINAVSDFSTPTKPLRRTANYKENLFARTVEGNALLDKACQMALAA